MAVSENTSCSNQDITEVNTTKGSICKGFMCAHFTFGSGRTYKPLRRCEARGSWILLKIKFSKQYLIKKGRNTCIILYLNSQELRKHLRIWELSHEIWVLIKKVKLMQANQVRSKVVLKLLSIFKIQERKYDSIKAKQYYAWILMGERGRVQTSVW